MGETTDTPHKVAGLIPYFFYDLYGRILPGLYLLSGLLLAFWCKPAALGLKSGVRDASASEWIIGSAIALAACFIVGLLLTEVTRITLWKLRVPVSIEDLRAHFGSAPEVPSTIESAFQSRFGFPLSPPSKSGTYLIGCGRLCEFVVISQSPAMDAVAVRVAAEELLSRSLFVASLILLPFSFRPFNWWALIVYSFVAVLSYGSYKHYRRKSILEKFQMFLALTQRT